MFNITKGIVLRSYPFRENQCISKVFTREFGTLSFIVKKTKNQVILSQPLNVVELTFQNSKNKTLFFAKEAYICLPYENILFNNKKLTICIVLCEILSKCLEEKNIELFDFVTTSFDWLNKTKENYSGFNSLFLIKLCQLHGIWPNIDGGDGDVPVQLDIIQGVFITNKLESKTIIPQKESNEIYKLSILEFDQLNTYNLSEELNNSIFDFIIIYISEHLTSLKGLKSIRVIKELN